MPPPSNINGELAEQHIERLKAGLSTGDLSFSDWILRNVRLKGKAFTFDRHEYQKTLLDDTHNKKVVKKCSQIGVSEVNLARALAFINLYQGTKLSYVLPSAKFAQKFIKMRLDPLVASSANIKARLEKGSDSSELKQFGDSFLMSQGASSASTTNVLAIDLDAIVVDELDGAENPDVINQLISRLTHSQYKDEFYLSTPTVPGYGISERYDKSKKFVLFQKCSRCNTWFRPDYYKHVFLPGYNAKVIDNTHNRAIDPTIGKRKGTSAAKKQTVAGAGAHSQILQYRTTTSKSLADISFLTADKIENCNLTDAFLQCPNKKCRLPLTIENLADPSTREFVCENMSSNAEFHGYHIPPFAVPTIITPGDLIGRSARYSRLQDFYNDALGLELSSKETGLDLDEIQSFFRKEVAFTSPSRPPYTVMGLDMGGECACTIGYPGLHELRVIYAEKIPLHKVRTRVSELYARFNVIAGVVDSMPYTDSVLMMQEKHPSLFASIFSKQKGLAFYDIREKGADDDARAMSLVRSISVSRDRGLDLLVASLRESRVVFDPLPMQNREITEHMMDLKRIHLTAKRGSTMEDEGRFVWRKTRGIDHYFFSLLYLFLASCMCSAMGTSSATLQGVPLIGKFKNKTL